MKIGLISDTHDYFDPRLAELFEGVTHILHAGDIGQRLILDRLEAIAPVTAVLGNNDLGLELRLFETLELAARTFLLHHIVHPHSPTEALRERLLRDQPAVVVSGHTHRATSLELGGRLYLNPGYAGRPRFGAARSVALLHCENGTLRPEFLGL
jgi:uncharacterized protein